MTLPRVLALPAAVSLLALAVAAWADPAPLPARLPNGWNGGATSLYEWNTRLDVPTWVISCDKSAADCKEVPLHWFTGSAQTPAGWMNFFNYQTTTRPGFAAPSGLPQVERARGFTVSLALAAQALLASQGAAFDGRAVTVGSRRIDLNAGNLARSVHIEVDPNNAAAVMVTVAGRDGSTERLRIAGGVATDLR